MDEFEIMQQEVFFFGLNFIWKEIDKIKCPYARTIERQEFFEVLKTLPIKLDEPNIMDMLAIIKTF